MALLNFHLKWIKKCIIMTFFVLEKNYQVPKIYWEFSSERVLTMEYCDGGKVDDIQYMKDNNISVNKVRNGGFFFLYAFSV